MKPKVYIETSVISYLTARASRDVVVAGHQQATQTFWERLESEFDPFVSSLVVEEAERGDAVLAAKRLAAMAGMNFVVTWNFSHINNPFTRTVIRQIVENAGYSCPELVSPDELLGEKE